MSQIPSSSPLWSPLKRRKVLDLEDLEPTVLFVQDSETSEAIALNPASGKPESETEVAGEIQCPATPPIHALHKSSDSFGQAKPNRSISIAIFDSDSEIETERNLLVSDPREEEDELDGAPSEIQTSQWYESSQILEPKLRASTASISESNSEEPRVESTQGSHGEDREHDTDNDNDDETCDGATQNYLRELLTESMIESLPLPPANRQALGMTLH